LLYSEIANGKRVPERRRADRDATLELRPVDATHVEFITREAGEVIHQETMEVEFEKKSGTTLIHRGEFAAGGIALVAEHAGLTMRFWQAVDGRLYVHIVARAVGAVAVVVPFVSTGEVWCRWDPATLAAREKQTADLGRLLGARQRAMTLNRNRATVGDVAPDFTGTDAVTGREVSSDDYEGKVVLVHFWSTKTLPRTLDAVRARYEKYHGRGLEVVGNCQNAANESEKVAQFIKANRLVWPQLYDGKGAQGEMFEAYAGSLPYPPLCVVDRRGNVAAVVFTATGDRLDAALEKALALP
jgi:peroxiredoxin